MLRREETSEGREVRSKEKGKRRRACWYTKKKRVSRPATEKLDKRVERGRVGRMAVGREGRQRGGSWEEEERGREKKGVGVSLIFLSEQTAGRSANV